MIAHLSTELLELTYWEDLDLLVGRWHYQPEPAELAGAYERLYAAFQRTQARHWLQDIRSRTLPDPYTTQWLFDDFFPDVAQLLRRQLRVAYVVGSALRGLIEAGPDFQPLAAYARKPFIVNFFGGELAALTWLYEA